MANTEKNTTAVDETELMVPNSYWPYPSYGRLLFDIR